MMTPWALGDVQFDNQVNALNGLISNLKQQLNAFLSMKAPDSVIQGVQTQIRNAQNKLASLVQSQTGSSATTQMLIPTAQSSDALPIIPIVGAAVALGVVGLLVWKKKQKQKLAGGLGYCSCG